MWSVTNNAEGGTNGAAVTSDSSGGASGTAWNTITYTGSGAAITFSNTHPRGTMSYCFSTSTTASTCNLEWTNEIPSSTTYYSRVYLYLPSYPTGSVRIMEFRDATETICMTVGMTSVGKLSIKDSAGASMNSTTLSVPLNQWTRIEVRCTPNSTTGQAQLLLFLDADSPYYHEKITSGTTFNTNPNGTNVSRLCVGLSTISIANYTYYMDGIGIAGAAYLGPADPTLQMPLVWYNSAEGGSDGTALTAINSGDASGNFFHVVNPGAGATFAFSSAQAAHGSLSILSLAATSVSNIAIWDGFSAPTCAFRLYLYMTGYPGAAHEVAQIRNSVGACGRIGVGTTGKFVVSDSTGTQFTSTSVMPLNTWLRLEIVAIAGTTTSNGTTQAAYYVGDSTTATESFTSSTLNNGTTSFIQLQWGKMNNNVWTTSTYFDDIAVYPGSSSFIGPYTGPVVVPAAYAGITPYRGFGVHI